MALRSSALARLGGALLLCVAGAACSDRDPSSGERAYSSDARSTGGTPGNTGGTTASTTASTEARKTAIAPVALGEGAPEEKPARTAALGERVQIAADGAQLYAQHCALCHGISGDGQGQTKLDPPARSFQEGKFSFGNTPEQLFKTITSGIPGRSPMPAFELVLGEDERRAIVKHLGSLMPIEEHASAESAELIVLGKTRFARGLLPPIAEGKPARERGLLVGRPEGLTFEYRIDDDVCLLGVRMGRFASRRDWGGRGGDALEPLGRLIALVQGGDPDPTFVVGKTPLGCAFRGTWVRGDESVIEIELFLVSLGTSAEDSRCGRFEESVEVIALREGTGFERRWRAVSQASAAIALESIALDPLGSRGASALWTEHGGWWWNATALEDGTTMVTAVRGGASKMFGDGDGRRVFLGIATPKPDEPSWRCVTLIASAWDDVRRDLVAKALTR